MSQLLMQNFSVLSTHKFGQVTMTNKEMPYISDYPTSKARALLCSAKCEKEIQLILKNRAKDEKVD